MFSGIKKLGAKIGTKLHSPDNKSAQLTSVDNVAARTDHGWSTGRLDIEIVAARGLAAKDKSGTSDPFVTIELVDPATEDPIGHNKAKTSVKKKTLAPEWKERFHFDDVRDPLPLIRLRVFDWNPMLLNIGTGKAKPLGQAVVAAAKAIEDRFESWLKLEPFDRLEAATGDVFVNLSLLAGTGDAHADAWAAADKTTWFQDVADSPKAANTALVAVIRARGLKAADGAVLGLRPASSSDPFVTLKLGEHEHKTKVVKKQLDPIWMESFELPLGNEALEVVVRDKDLVTSDFLGRASIDLTSAARRRAPPQGEWFSLCDKNGEPVADRGQIQLAIKLTYDQANDASEDRPFFEEENDNAASSMPPNELRLAVCRARGLAAKDSAIPFSSRGARSDPYVNITFLGKTVRTKIKNQTLSPVWNEVFSFDFEKSPKNRLLDIEFQVMDYDMADSDDFLGLVVMPLSRLPPNGAVLRQWFPLGERSQRAGGDGTLGHLLVVLQYRYSQMLDFRPFSEDEEQPTTKSPNELRVALFRGRDLAIKDKLRASSDPRVKFRLSGCGNDLIEWSSSTRTSTLEPIWREVYAKRFVWLADHPDKPALRLKCEDVDELTSADFMGVIELPLSHLAQDGTILRGWQPLTVDDAATSTNVSGEIHLTVQWRYNAAYDFDPWANSDVVDNQVDPKRQPNELRIGLVRGRNLAVKDNPMLYGSGSSDPRIVFELKGSKMTSHKKWKSKVIRRSLQPNWCEKYTIPYSGEETLTCVCEDWDELTSADFMGCFEVKLSSQRTRAWYQLTSDADQSSSNVSGEIELITVLAYNPDLDFDPWASDIDDGQGEPNELCVGLVRGQSLAIKDKAVLYGTGSSDPRVRLSIMNGLEHHRAMSRTVKKSLDPSWREKFTILLTDDNVRFGANGPTLEVVCEDVDEISSTDFMGKIEIQLSPIKRQWTRGWYKLQGGPESSNVSGELELIVFWRRNKALDFEPFEEPDEHPDKPPNELRIGLAQGRDLAIKDKALLFGTGSSDPRVRFQIQGLECVSSIRKRTLNPSWREVFSLAPVTQTQETPSLLVICEDVDEITTADDMGIVRIEIEPHVRMRRWYPLQNRGDAAASSNVRGQLDLITQHWYNPAHDFEPFPELEAGEQDDSEGWEKPPNELRIALIQGRNLAVKDKNLISSTKKGSSDPYISFKLGELNFKSTHVSKSLTPVWRQIFHVPLTEPSSRLDCVCFDYDAFSSHDYMGEFAIEDIGSLEGKKTRRWYELTSTQGQSQNVSGEVELVLHHWYNPALDFEPFCDDADDNDEPPNEVRIALVQGRGLASKDKSLFGTSSSDPRVRFELGAGVTCVSSVKRKTLSPIWRETFALPWTRGPSDHEDPVLSVYCEDVDEISNADFMGSIRIQLEEKKRTRAWYALGDDAEGSGLSPSSNVMGELEIVVHWRHSHSLSFVPFADTDDDRTRSPNELRVGLIQGRNLSQNKGVDPVVRFTVPGCQDFESTVRRNNPNPIWNEVFEKPIANATAEDVLEVACCDWNATKNLTLGKCVIPLAPILTDRRAKRAWYMLDNTASAVELWTHFRYNAALDFSPFADDDATDGKTPNEVRVGLSQGRYLGAKGDDRHISRASPGFRVEFSVVPGSGCITSTTKKTSEPSWRQVLALECEDQTAVLHCTCESVGDLCSTAKIGSVDVELAHHVDQRVAKRWYSLSNNAGELELVVQYWYNPNLDWLPFQFSPDSGKVPNEVHVAVSRGRRLKAADFSFTGGSNSSDPRVRLELGEIKHFTKHKNKSLNPIWREQFVFTRPASSILQVVCEDYDSTSKCDEIGRCEVDLEPLKFEPVVKRWYPLGEEQNGELELIIGWTYNEVADFDPFADTDSADTTRPPNELRVGLSHARNLTIGDKPFMPGGDVGSSDPRIRLKVAGIGSWRSMTKHKTLNPSYKEVFQIPLVYVAHLDSQPKLECICENAASISTKIIGEFEIDLAPIADHKVHRAWYQLNGDKASSGEVELVLQWRFNHDLDYDPFASESADDSGHDQNGASNELRVALVMGRGLAAKDSGWLGGKASSDPRMRFSVRGAPEVTFASHVKKQTVNPVWKETWSLPLDRGEALCCCCEDWDTSSKADPIGEPFEVPLGPLRAHKKPVRRWYDLGASGSIELITQWRYNKSLDFQPFSDSDALPSKPPNELRIGLSRGRQLRAMDAPFLGSSTTMSSSDPRVQFAIVAEDGVILHRMKPSSTKKRTLEPRWFESSTMVFRHCDLRPAFLQCICEDTNVMTANKEIGRLKVDLEALATDQRVNKQWYKLEPVESGSAGELELVLQWVYSPLHDYDPFGEDHESPEFAVKGKAPNELRVALIRGRGLAAKDTNLLSKPSSDPRMSFSVPGTGIAFTSHAQKQTLEPVWKETWSVVLEDEVEDAGGSGYILKCACEDWDALSSADSLGHFEIALETLRHGKPVRDWHELKGGAGEVELIVQWRYNPTKDFSAFILAEDDPTQPPNELRIGLSRARRLVDANDSAIRCVFSAPSQAMKVKSTIKQEAPQLSWNEVLTMPVDSKHIGGHTLSKLVCECEKVNVLSSADSLGRFEVDLAELLATRSIVKRWYALNGPIAGEIELILFWRYNAANDYDPFDSDGDEDGEVNELGVALVRGFGLTARDNNLFTKKSSDPRVRFSVKNTTIAFTSHVVRQTTNPVWKENWRRPLEAGEKDYVLECVCEDCDELSNADPLGHVEVPIVAFRKVRGCYELIGDNATGAIEIIVYWRYRRAMDWRPFSPASDDEEIDAPPNELRIGLAQARGLKIMDRNLIGDGGSSDPRIRFEIKTSSSVTQLFTSSTQHRTINPVWREILLCDLPCNETTAEGRLVCNCEDAGTVSKLAAMGSVEIPLSILANKQVQRCWYALDAGEGGDLQLVLQWRTNSSLLFAPFQEEDEHPDRDPNELRVALIQGRDLTATSEVPCLRGGGDEAVVCPRVLFQCGRRVHFHSETKQQTSNPRWMQIFAAELPFEPDARYELSAYCEDASRKRTTKLGMLKTPINVSSLADHRLWRNWCSLEPHGSLEIAVRWCYNPGLDFAPFEGGDDEIDKPRNELRLALIRGRDFPIKNRNLLTKGGSSDPRATLIVCSSRDGREIARFVSKVKRRTLAPVWREQWIEHLACDGELLLQCAVDDCDSLQSCGLLGSIAPISLDTLERGKVYKAWHKLDSAKGGEVEFAIQWLHNPAHTFEAFTEDSDDSNEGEGPPNELRVAIVQARYVDERVKRHQVSITSTHLGDKPIVTSFVSKPLVWRETFVRKVEVPGLQMLELDIRLDGDQARVAVPARARSRAWHACGKAQVEMIVQWRYASHLDNKKQLREARAAETVRVEREAAIRRERYERLEAERKERDRQAALRRREEEAALKRKEEDERTRRNEARKRFEEEGLQAARRSKNRHDKAQRLKKLNVLRQQEETRRQEERSARREALVSAERERIEAMRAVATRRQARERARRAAQAKVEAERREAALAAREASHAALKSARNRWRTQELDRLKVETETRARRIAEAKTERLRQLEAARAAEEIRRAEDLAFRDRLEIERRRKLARFTQLRLVREANAMLQRERDLRAALADPNVNWAPPRFASNRKADFVFVPPGSPPPPAPE